MLSLATLGSLAVCSLAGLAQAYDNDAMRSKAVYQVGLYPCIVIQLERWRRGTDPDFPVLIPPYRS